MRKLGSLKVESKKIALEEVENSIRDLRVVKRSLYIAFLPYVINLIKGKADREILAAAICSRSDCLVTGDRHFHTAQIEKIIKVRFSKDFLQKNRLIG